LTGEGPVAVISDAAILSSARRTTLTDLHPGATPEQVQAPTGWNLKQLILLHLNGITTPNVKIVTACYRSQRCSPARCDFIV
jgi:hypothetical protein